MSKPMIYWGLLILGFAGLTQFRSNATLITPQVITGIQAAQQTFTQNVTVTGTLESLKTKNTGLTVLTLQADDGQTLHVTVPPTIQTKLPRIGERVQLQAHQLDKGLLTLTSSEDIKHLQASWQAPPEHVNFPMGHKPFARITTEGQLVLATRLNSGAYTADLTRNTELVTPVVIPANVARETQNIDPMTSPYVHLVGHMSPDRVFIAEDIQPFQPE